MVCGLWFVVCGSRFGVSGLGFGVWGFWFRVEHFRSRVSGATDLQQEEVPDALCEHLIRGVPREDVDRDGHPDVFHQLLQGVCDVGFSVQGLGCRIEG